MVEAVLRPVIAKINLSALSRNIKKIKTHLTPNQQFYAVVKADAYGHGAIEIAKAAQQNGVDGFCVALLDEAIELRKNGITLPILVMGITDANLIPMAITNDVMLTVATQQFLEEAVQFISDKPLKVHIALNTGMNRIGFKSETDMKQLVAFLAQHQQQFIGEGVFTHFATADGENDNYVQKQFEQFEVLKRYLKPYVNTVHLANSAMTLWRQQFPSDIVRVGIAMYGLNPSDVVLALPFELEPVLSLTTRVTFKQFLKKGESVSYGATYMAKNDEWIATLPIGYADGWSRRYAKNGVYIADQKCDVLGVICMDQMMIRISENVAVGQSVELIGLNQSATDIAVTNGTIGYEVLCGLSPRIHREYITES